MFSGLDIPIFLSSFDKALVVGPRHAPAKLELKITCSHFIDFADLLSANLHYIKHETYIFPQGKLLVSNKCLVLEIMDILTWTKAFTIFQMMMCSTHPHRWPNLTKYKSLIIQTAWLSPGLACLEYDLALKKDATATGTTYWSWMNLNLYMGDSEEKHLPRLNSVHGIIPIYPDQDPRCLSSQTMVGLHSRGSPSGSVPVQLFSP